MCKFKREERKRKIFESLVCSTNVLKMFVRIEKRETDQMLIDHIFMSINEYSIDI